MFIGSSRSVNGAAWSFHYRSLGATVMEMLTAKPPCHKFEHYQAMFKIGNLKCEEDIEILFPVKHKLSDAACEFLKGIFVSYEQRPYAWDLKDDTWLTTSST